MFINIFQKYNLQNNRTLPDNNQAGFNNGCRRTAAVKGQERKFQSSKQWKPQRAETLQPQPLPKPKPKTKP